MISLKYDFYSSAAGKVALRMLRGTPKYHFRGTLTHHFVFCVTNKIEILFARKTAYLQGFLHKKRPQGIASSRSFFIVGLALFLMRGRAQKHLLSRGTPLHHVRGTLTHHFSFWMADKIEILFV